MELLRSIIFIVLRDADHLGHQLPMRYATAPQFVSHDFPGLSAMGAQQALEKPVSSDSITSSLQIHVNHFTMLTNRTP
jgi:hypothetical protein